MPARSWEVTPAELRRLRAALDRIVGRGGLDAALDALAGWALALIDASGVLVGLSDGPAQPMVVRAAAGRGCRTLPGKSLDEAVGAKARSAQTWLRAPIVLDERERGTVVARPRRGQRFEPGDTEILRLLAVQAALAVRQEELAGQNQVLYQRERRRAEQLQAAADLTRRTVRVGRLGDLLELSASTLKSRFGYEQVRLYLREDGRDTFALRARAGGNGRLGETLDLAGDTLAAWAARSGEPQLAHRVPGQEQLLDHAELAVPMTLEGRPIGVLVVSAADPSGLDTGDLALAESVADDLALAIENLRLAARVRSDAAAAERSRLARELHDDTAQQLVAIGRQLELLAASCDPAAGERIEAVHGMVDEALANVRRISRNLRPSLLDELGLVAAIEALVADQTRQGGPPIELRVLGRARPLAPAVELALYRIAQEALANALKHAEAERVDLRLRFGDPVVLEVADDGRGMAAEGGLAGLARGGGMGVVGMRERASEVGGELTIAAQPGRGTVVRVRVPAG
jgi:signal transduction histidine kinase